jgi:5-methylcytosine-specific restriction protein B
MGSPLGWDDPTMNDAHEEQFELNGKDAHAIGVWTEDGFIVRAGAIARKEIVPSGPNFVASVRKRLLSEGVLVEEEEGLRFLKDWRFDSPSGAASAVLGRAANGWTEWKSADGQTLSILKRVSRDEQQPLLGEAQRRTILECYQELAREDKVPTQQQLDREHSLFRERFGPSVLAGLDGEPLLTLMHDQGQRDSLVYWLEFKNDDEFHTRDFGSIAGGSALKFRIFRRKETGNWQTGDKSNYPKDIPVEQAADTARSHRDQLLRGHRITGRVSRQRF